MGAVPLRHLGAALVWLVLVSRPAVPVLVSGRRQLLLLRRTPRLGAPMPPGGTLFGDLHTGLRPQGLVALVLYRLGRMLLSATGWFLCRPPLRQRVCKP